MKSLVILSCLLAVAFAKPSGVAVSSPILSALNVPIAHSSVSYSAAVPGQIISYSSPVAHVSSSLVSAPVAYSASNVVSAPSAAVVSSPVAYGAAVSAPVVNEAAVVSSPVAYSAAPAVSHSYSSSVVAAPAASVVSAPVASPVAYSAAPAVSHSYRSSVVSSPIVAAAPAASVVSAPVAYSAAPAVSSSYSSSVVAAAPAAASVVSAPVVSNVAYNAAPVAYSAAPAVSQSYSSSVIAAPAASSVVSAPVFNSVVSPVAYSAGLIASAPVYAAAAPILAAKSQYHSQDSLGQAAYGHSEPLQNHNAIQDAAGNKVGSYSYVAPDGQVIAANYVADALGYRVASNALPVAPAPVAESPEVVAARNAHFQAHAVANSRAKRSVAVYSAPYVSQVAYSVPAAVSSQQLSVVHPSPLVHQPFAAAYHVY